jgi:hypothetical protein
VSGKTMATTSATGLKSMVPSTRCQQSNRDACLVCVRHARSSNVDRGANALRASNRGHYRQQAPRQLEARLICVWVTAAERRRAGLVCIKSNL